MELKEFIKETLSQIIDGISETQEKYESKKVMICPNDIQGNNEVQYIEDESQYSMGYHRRNRVQNIEMNIAISISEKEGSKSGIGISQIINAGISSQNTSINESISKIKFSIPIVFPTTDTRAYFRTKEKEE